MKGVIITIIRKWLEKQGYSITNKEEDNTLSLQEKEDENFSTSFLFGLYRNRIKHITPNAIIMTIIQWIGISTLLAFLPRIIKLLELLFSIGGSRF
jgi:hypothetical protein